MDFDGTIADTNAEKVAWIKREIGVDITPDACNRTDCVPIIGSSNYERMGVEVYGQLVTSRLKPVTGAVEILTKLANEFPLILITARGLETGCWAQQWLDKFMLSELFSDVILASGFTKLDFCASKNVSCLIDDDIRHLALRPDLKILRIHLGAHKSLPASAEVPIQEARSWFEVEKLVKSRHVGKAQ